MGLPASVNVKQDNADVPVFIALYPHPSWKSFIKNSITFFVSGENGSVFLLRQKSTHFPMYVSYCLHVNCLHDDTMSSAAASELAAF